MLPGCRSCPAWPATTRTWPGSIRHALRFTASSSCAGYVAPARHEAGSGSCNVEPPMGLRVRLKASVDISHFSAQAKVILQALKTYGMILADNGSPWYISGASDPHWNDDVLHTLGQIKGSDFGYPGRTRKHTIDQTGSPGSPRWHQSLRPGRS